MIRDVDEVCFNQCERWMHFIWPITGHETDSSIILVDDQTVAFAHQTLMDIGALSDDGKLTALGPAIFIVSVVSVVDGIFMTDR